MCLLPSKLFSAHPPSAHAIVRYELAAGQVWRNSALSVSNKPTREPGEHVRKQGQRWEEVSVCLRLCVIDIQIASECSTNRANKWRKGKREVGGKVGGKKKKSKRKKKKGGGEKAAEGGGWVVALL